MSSETSEHQHPEGTHEHTPGPAPSPSPGAQIRVARERRHWSVDDLAAQTKLARHTLEALERDDFDALLEPVYVRGYYRKCAKVLEIDDDALIAAYSGRVVQQLPTAPSKLRLASGTELGSSSRLPVVMAVVLVLIAIGASAFIWFSGSDRTGYPDVQVPALGEEQMPIPLTDVMTEPAAEEEQPLAAEPVATEPPAAEDEPVADEAAAADAPAETATAATTPAATGDRGVRLQFTETSWVRVDDADGKTLLNAMRQGGSEELVSGTMPLNVFLGNAPGVIVHYNGQRIETAPFTRSNKTARFSVPLQ